MSFLRQFLSPKPVVVPAVAPTLPEGWVRYEDKQSKQSRPYYVNTKSGITQWEFPSSSSVAAPVAAPVVPAKPVAPVAAPVKPATSVVPPHKDPCVNPYDRVDLYYYISSQNGQGPYIPVTEKELWHIARKATGNESNQMDSNVYTQWTTSDIPNTNATGCKSQNLGNSGIFFGVRVDGLNKMIIDAYNAKFTNRPPIETLVPLETKYFYYVRWINQSKEYLPRNLTSIDFALAPSEGRRLSSDYGWGKGNPQNIPNTNAIGFMTSAEKNSTGIGKFIYVRVDRANNAIIEAYNESLTKPLPPGWEEVKQASGQIFYKNISGIVQEVRPTSEAPEPIPSSPLPPGWEYLKDDAGRIYYGNPILKIKQYNRPDNLPPGWEELREEASGKLYYKNISGIVQYDRPLPPLPPGWVEMKDPNGEVYYRNPSFGIHQYKRPVQLPPGWEYMTNKTRERFYYVNPSLYIAQYAFPTTPSSSTPAPAAPVAASASLMENDADNTNNIMVKPANIVGAPSTSSAPPSSTDPSTSSLPPLPPGWEYLKNPTSGKLYYGNPSIKLAQNERPLPIPPGWEYLKDPTSGKLYYGNPSLKIAQNERPILFEMGDQKFSSTKQLLDHINSTCTTQECKINLDPVATAAATAAGGSKNKKHGRGTKRRRRRKSRRGGRKTHHRSRKGGIAWLGPHGTIHHGSPLDS